mmetsp:Transcript_2056/g.5239  ORF Transcript_2056/g.5239 Transcript_2056/m.5239 type:complete len:286 (-) Transcript_2056:683-1540(-)
MHTCTSVPPWHMRFTTRSSMSWPPLAQSNMASDPKVSIAAAASTLPPVDCRACMACSLVYPRPVSEAMAASIGLLAAGAGAAAAGAGADGGAAAATGAGCDDVPAPWAPDDAGWLTPPSCPPRSASAMLFLASSSDTSVMNPLSLTWLSGMKSTSRSMLPNLSFPRTRSMMHAWRRMLSSPKMNCGPDFCSSTLMGDVRKWPPTLSGAWCTRPRILDEPTPTAMPWKRLSIRRVRKHFSAISAVMMDICAPVSQNALTGTPLTSMSTYSISMWVNASGLCSHACM